jgi:hypothetical protein
VSATPACTADALGPIGKVLSPSLGNVVKVDCEGTWALVEYHDNALNDTNGVWLQAVNGAWVVPAAEAAIWKDPSAGNVYTWAASAGVPQRLIDEARAASANRD